jgi:hypothetical protein
VDNIKTNLKELECENVDWIYLAQDRVESLALVNELKQWEEIKCGDINTLFIYYSSLFICKRTN